MTKSPNKYLWPLILITSLFFLWALAYNMNDILIKQFQKVLDLSRGFAITTQFFYVGAQVGIWSYFIDYMIDVVPGTPEKTAAYFISANLVAFMIGRFTGSFLMTYIKPNRLLAIMLFLEWFQLE